MCAYISENADKLSKNIFYSWGHVGVKQYEEEGGGRRTEWWIVRLLSVNIRAPTDCGLTSYATLPCLNKTELLVYNCRSSWCHGLSDIIMLLRHLSAHIIP